MTADRRRLEQDESLLIRNMPLRPRERAALLDLPDTFHIGSEDGEVFLAHEEGQQRLYWAFRTVEDMRQQFPGMWQEALKHIDRESVDYVALDLSGLPTRDWLDPLLRDADFELFAEWMEMTNPDLDADAVPEFPDGMRMRRATDDDVERMHEIWIDAYDEYRDGDHTFDWMLEHAAWAGALDDADGEMVAFAMNGPVERSEGRVLTAAVDPAAWGQGYGRLILGAAVYQLASREAVRATVKVRPDIKQSMRTCADLGFRFARAGVEFRRSTDEDEIRAAREARRVSGVKARFGGWR